MAQPGKKLPWEDKLLRAGFFVGAVLVHLIVFALVATYVIFPSIAPQPDASLTHQFIPPAQETRPKAPPIDTSDATTANASASASAASNGPDSPVAIHSDNLNFVVPVGPVGPGDLKNVGLAIPPKIEVHGMSPERLRLIRDTATRYRPPGDATRGDKSNPIADFPVYVASYANGDWSCNLNLDAEGNIVSGSIPNLVAKINEWTHGRISGHVAPKPLDIAGPELLAKMPPFIFFTGHKDFVLTDQEISNLRQYLVAGGAIWGDNALAGRGSRFDVAFHREMKRIVDKGEDFQPLTADTDIFKSHFQIGQTPQGMNYYSEPIEHLDLDGKLAILYTPDDYSDLYTMRILPGDQQIQGTLPAPGSELVTSGLFLSNRNVYFRNFTLPSSLAVHRLGLNIVTYLLTRFDDEILLTP
jgi:hypothetical protein